MSRGAVLVTGASSGIGAATARELGARGFEVFGTFREPVDAGRLEAAGVHPVRLDVTDREAVTAARDELEARLGARGLAGLVNNAGIAVAGPVELAPIEAFQAAIRVNFFGTLHVTRAFLPLVRAARGRIVMMSSLSGRVGMPLLGPYAASKFALEGVADCLRRELRSQGIRVVLVEPGPVVTPIWDQVDSHDAGEFDGTPYERAARRLSRAAIEARQAGLPAERVARVVAHALVARFPPPRIVVASPGGRWKVRLIRGLPDRVADWLIVWARG